MIKFISSLILVVLKLITFLFFLWTEIERRIRANDPIFNSKFNYAVSITLHQFLMFFLRSHVLSSLMIMFIEKSFHFKLTNINTIFYHKNIMLVYHVNNLTLNLIHD